ncbi:tetratricopeptide repeat protein [Mycolicibacterium boenickei]
MDEPWPAVLVEQTHAEVLTALDEGRIEDAVQQAKQVIDSAEREFGQDSSNFVSALLTAAAAAEVAGNFGVASSYAERAARVAAPWTHFDDPDLVSLWAEVETRCAALESTLGEYEPAETRLAAALVAASRVLPADAPCIIDIHNMRGVTAKYAGRFDEAEIHYRQVQRYLDVEPIGDPIGLAGLLHNLGGLDHSRGRFADGLVHAERGLRLRIATVGDRHPDVGRDLNAIGALHHDAGDMPAAMGAYRRALRIFEPALGMDNFEVGMTFANLAVSTAMADDDTLARFCYDRALQIIEPCLGSGHPDVALVKCNLAVLLAKQGDRDSALDMLDDAESALTAGSIADDHPRVVELRATRRELRSSQL